MCLLLEFVKNSACHRLRKVWNWKLLRQLKERLFLATVESILLYVAKALILTRTMEKQISGYYTRMLGMAFNISYKDHMTNHVLYGNLPQVSIKINQWRLILAVHCLRHMEEIANRLVFGSPTRKPEIGESRISHLSTIFCGTQKWTIHENCNGKKNSKYFYSHTSQKWL